MKNIFLLLIIGLIISCNDSETTAVTDTTALTIDTQAVVTETFSVKIDTGAKRDSASVLMLDTTGIK